MKKNKLDIFRSFTGGKIPFLGSASTQQQNLTSESINTLLEHYISTLPLMAGGWTESNGGASIDTSLVAHDNNIEHSSKFMDITVHIVKDKEMIPIPCRIYADSCQPDGSYMVDRMQFTDGAIDNNGYIEIRDGKLSYIKIENKKRETYPIYAIDLVLKK